MGCSSSVYPLIARRLLSILLPVAFLSNIILFEVFNDHLYAHKLPNLYLQSVLFLEFQMYRSYYLLHI